MTNATQTGTAVAVQQPLSHRPISVFSSEADFASAQRLCKALTSSNLVPESYRGDQNMGNALVALDMANRMSIPPLMVMQNLDVIEGRPSWKSQFIIGALNSCGLFSPIRFRKVVIGEQEVAFERWTGPKGSRSKETVKTTVKNIECTAYAVEKATGEVLEGPTVSIAMAVQEGWYFRTGSKWPTMPDLMLMYRAAAFFGRLYAPHVLNGMPSADEVLDVDYEVGARTPVDVTPKAETAEVETAKPAGRPKGVHAAMKAAKEADKPKAAKAAPKPENKAEEAEEENPAPAKQEPATPAHDPATGEIEDEEDGEAGDDVFDVEDEDYDPA